MKLEEKFIRYCEKLGKHINELREENFMSIKELSLNTGIRAEYLRKIEKGKAYGVMLEKHPYKISKALK